MGLRVIKTAIAVVVAIYLAEWLGLSSPNSAGLLAILGVEVTKKKGIISALHRIAASLLGLIIGSLLFHVFGFHIWLIGLFVMVVYPLLHRMHIAEGAVTGSVVMLHIYTGGVVSIASFWNEVQLLLIGLGTATLINIAYMPKPDKALYAYKDKVEHLFSQIFLHISILLRDNDIIWDGKELLEAEVAVSEGTALAKRLQDNSLIFGGDSYWSVYFYMRGEQLESIEQMIGLVAQVYQTLPQGESLASIFEELMDDVKEEYYVGRNEERLIELERSFKKLPLPQSREEFEVRAALFQLHIELDHYLSIAKKQKKQRPKTS